MHPKHPKKEINEALDHADSLGLVVERTSAGHKWGRIVCVEGEWVRGVVHTAQPVRPRSEAAEVG